MNICHVCSKPVHMMTHEFEEGLAPVSREHEERRLKKPIRNRRWSYHAPLYHLIANGVVVWFCSPNCATAYSGKS